MRIFSKIQNCHANNSVKLFKNRKSLIDTSEIFILIIGFTQYFRLAISAKWEKNSRKNSSKNF